MIAVLLALGCGAQATAQDQSVAFPLKFRFAQNADFQGVVNSIESSGSGVAVALNGPEWRDYETNISEGLYVAIICDKFEGLIPQNGSLAKAQIVEVLKDNKVRFRVAAATAPKIKKGRQIAFLRPIGSSTLELRAVPDFLTLSEPNVPNGDSMKPSDRALMDVSMNKLRQIVLAIRNYESAHRRYPPQAYRGKDGKPTVSWRVLILPYLEEAQLFQQFKLDEPWDGPHNKALLQKMPDVYRDPIYGDSKTTFTSYAGVAGPGTIFPTDGPDSKGLRGEGNRDGLQESDIADGYSKTLFVGTVSPQQKIPWTKPEDIICIDKLPAFGKPGSFAAPFKTATHSAGLFSYGDAHVQSIRSDVDMTEFHKLVTCSGGEPIDDSKIRELVPESQPTEMVLTITNSSGAPKATLELRVLPEKAAH